MAISFFGESKRRKVRPATKLSHTLKVSKKDRQHNGKKKKDRQHNCKKKKNKKTNNGLQNTTQKTGVNSGAVEG
jgi:hypothetical protein